MRKLQIVLALALLTAATSGCTRCRHLFRRGAPCGGTRMAAPSMLGGAIPLGNPMRPRLLQPQMMAQPDCCYEQCLPCDPCQNACPEDCYQSSEPCCESGSGYLGETVGPGEYFGGYTEGSTVPASAPRGSGTYDPQPTN